MARQKVQLPYKIKKRIFANGTESKDYYAQVKNELGKKVWIKLGVNYKEAEKILKEEVLKIAKKKQLIEKEEIQEKNKADSTSFFNYLNENHYFEPELNVQYVFYKKTGRESYGLNHSKQVASYFHRLFDEDKQNDPIGKIPYKKITHQDAVDFWLRLESSSFFQTNGVRNRLLDILSSTYKFIMKDDDTVSVNPFRTISPFNDAKEKKEREGMTVEQIRLLFTNEEVINKKVVSYLISKDEEKTEKKIETVQKSDKKPSEKQRLINDLRTWREKKKETYQDYRFTDTVYYKYFKFILGTGIRGAECRALQYSAFSQYPYVKIEKGFKVQTSNIEGIGDPKWGKKRIVYLCDTLQQMMNYSKPLKFNPYTNKHEFVKPEDAFVFSQDEDGKTPLCLTEIRRRWTMFVCAMGFDEHLFTPHSLRHSMAALLMDNGVPEWFVVKWCGWETSSTNKMVLNYAKKKWNFEYPEYRELIAPIIEENYYSPTK